MKINNIYDRSDRTNASSVELRTFALVSNCPLVQNHKVIMQTCMLVLLVIDDYMYKTCPPQPLGVKTIHRNPSQCAWQGLYIYNVDRTVEIKCKQGKCGVFWLQDVME